MDQSDEEAGAAFNQRGLKPTEDRFMRLDDMERFVRAAEQREMEDDEDDEDVTGDESGVQGHACSGSASALSRECCCGSKES